MLIHNQRHPSGRRATAERRTCGSCRRPRKWWTLPRRPGDQRSSEYAPKSYTARRPALSCHPIVHRWRDRRCDRHNAVDRLHHVDGVLMSDNRNREHHAAPPGGVGKRHSRPYKERLGSAPILFAIVATMLVGCGTAEQQAACLQVTGSRWNQPAYGQCLDRMTGTADNGLGFSLLVGAAAASAAAQQPSLRPVGMTSCHWMGTSLQCLSY
jgi:hypothetical protein